mgnify:CR=1 FL=1
MNKENINKVSKADDIHTETTTDVSEKIKPKNQEGTIEDETETSNDSNDSNEEIESKYQEATIEDETETSNDSNDSNDSNEEIESEYQEGTIEDETETLNDSNEEIESEYQQDNIDVKVNSADTIIGKQNNEYYCDSKFEDPTHTWELDYDFEQNISIPEKTFNTYVQALKTSRIIMLYSEDDSFVNNTIHDIVSAITKLPSCKTYETRYLDWNRINNTKKGQKNKVVNYDSKITIDSFTGKNYENDKTTFLKVNLSNLDFLKSIYISNKEHSSSITKELQNNKLFIICKIEHDLYNEINSSKKLNEGITLETGNFLFKESSFIHNYLRHHFKEDAPNYIEKISHQVVKGFWGVNITKKELRDVFVNSLKLDPELVLAAIKERNSSDYKTKKDKFLDSLPLHKQPYKTIIFTATFFPDINTTDFRNLINYLLGEKEEVFTYEEDVLDQENNIQKIQVRSKKRLRDVWLKEGDKILDECKIVTQKLDNGRVCYAFTTLNIDSQIDEYFETRLSLFLIKQYEKLIKSDVLFTSGASELLINNLLQLVSKVAIYDPERYALQLLKNLHIKLFFDEDWEIKLDKNKDFFNPNASNFKKILKNREREVQTDIFLGLITELLKNIHLIRKQVFLFFKYLLSISHYQKSQYDLALLLIEKFSEENLIDSVTWIKTTLQYKSDLDTCKSLIRFLNKDIRNWGEDTPLKLKQIHGWLPNKTLKQYNYVQIYAALSILNIGNPIVNRFPVRLYGEYPYKFPLLYPLKHDVDTTDYFCFLIKWLFNSHTLNILTNTNGKNVSSESYKNEGSKLLTNQTFILESWVLIINGIDDDDKSSIKETFTNALVRAIKLTIDNNLIREIQLKLFEFSQQYSEEINNHASKPHDDQNILFYELYKAKYKTTLYLTEQLNK